MRAAETGAVGPRSEPGGAALNSAPVPTRLLRAPLARFLARRRPRARIASIERSPAPYRSSWWLEDLRVGLTDGTAVELVFKDLGRPTPGSAADRAKPRRVVEPGREPWVYRSVLEPLGRGTPSLWGSVPRPGQGRHWLFLERIGGVPLAEVGAPEAWAAAAAWLGRFHVAVGGLPTRGGPLLRHDARLHRWWFRRAVALTADADRRDAGSETRSATLRGLRRIHHEAVDALAEVPRTLIHGEFYPSNVLLDGGRVRPVDWEMAGVGPALLDLAALTAGSWSDGERAAMALAYRDAVLRAGADVEPLDRFLLTLTRCRLLLAVQWLGWQPGWEPPPEHRQDWLGEALRCAEALEER